MNMISKYLTILPVAAALLLAACSKDEMGEAGTTLSDGAYPLEIGSVSITAEVSDEPSTRVSESSDGASSVFEDGDKIQVQIGSGTAGTYTYSSGSWTVADGDSPAYWLSAADGQTITAWYASNETDGTVNLSDQSAGLAYVLQASTTANFNESATLSFSHQLAKVRVSLSGTAASGITCVEVYSSTSCSFDPTTQTLTASENQDYIPMKQCTYSEEDAEFTCWEANVVPGEISSGTIIRLNGSTIVSLSGISSLEAGKIHVVDVAIYNEGETLVSTEADLIAAVANGGTIALTANIALTGDLSVTGSGVTIDLNGYSITRSNTDYILKFRK